MGPNSTNNACVLFGLGGAAGGSLPLRWWSIELVLSVLLPASSCAVNFFVILIIVFCRKLWTLSFSLLLHLACVDISLSLLNGAQLVAAGLQPTAGGSDMPLFVTMARVLLLQIQLINYLLVALDRLAVICCKGEHRQSLQTGLWCLLLLFGWVFQTIFVILQIHIPFLELRQNSLPDAGQVSEIGKWVEFEFLSWNFYRNVGIHALFVNFACAVCYAGIVLRFNFQQRAVGVQPSTSASSSLLSVTLSGIPQQYLSFGFGSAVLSSEQKRKRYLRKQKFLATKLPKHVRFAGLLNDSSQQMTRFIQSPTTLDSSSLLERSWITFPNQKIAPARVCALIWLLNCVSYGYLLFYSNYILHNFSPDVFLCCVFGCDYYNLSTAAALLLITAGSLINPFLYTIRCKDFKLELRRIRHYLSVRWRNRD